MGSAVPEGVNLLMISNRVFRLRFVQICAVPTWTDFDLLMLRNRAFSLRIFQKCELPTWKDFDLLIIRIPVFSNGNVNIWVVPSCKVFRNCVFKMRNVQICVVPTCKGSIRWLSGLALSCCKSFRNGQCSLARALICWCSRMVFSGGESLKYV